MRPGAQPPSGDRPEFTWDVDRLRLTWANRGGLAFWGEDSLTDLVERVFAPDDETVRALAARMADLAEGGDGRGRLPLNPRGAPLWAMADCRIERFGDGRDGLRVSLGAIETPSDAELARVRAAFDIAPRPTAMFAASGEALARNEADRRAFPTENAGLKQRYAEAGVAEAAIAAALGDGAFSHTASLTTRTGPRRHRITLRRMRDPIEGGLCLIADFGDQSDRPVQAAGGQVSLDALAGLAHDFRSPLTAIQGFAEFMQMSGDRMPAEKRDEYFQNIQLASRRLMRLADRMVALGVKGAEGAGGRLARVDLSAVAREATRLCALRAAETGVTLSLEVDRPVVEVAADPDATERIVDNLIANALSHGAPRGGAVRVSVRDATNEDPPMIEVADDGAGLSAGALAEALHPGGRDGGDRSRPGGLGLSTSVDLAASMAARLEFDTAPDQGFAARLIFAL